VSGGGAVGRGAVAGGVAGRHGPVALAWLGLAAAGWGCAGPSAPSDYDAGAVVRGSVRTAAGEPVAGARIGVGVRRDGCDGTETLAAASGVVTDAAGDFEGEYAFLAPGPVVAECVRLVVVDAATTVVIGDTLVPTATRFDAERSDTLEVYVELQP
jgi:hypothetical protein